ncbi:MAG: DUF5947 family protein [Streptosporangiaceae bacterium]
MSTGLRKFTQAAQPEPPEPPEQEQAGEQCEMCVEPIGGAHSHVVNTGSRSIMCVCRACYLLFTHSGAAGGKYRAVPDRYLYDPAFTISEVQWNALQIPVGMAFFFPNSDLDQWVAFYPSPAGATESLLPLEAWEEIIGDNPMVGDAAPDVEAILLRRREEHFECYLVPIDACYELVGRVRLHWKGFGGGEEAWQAIDDFFANVRERAKSAVGRVAAREGGGDG